MPRRKGRRGCRRADSCGAIMRPQRRRPKSVRKRVERRLIKSVLGCFESRCCGLTGRMAKVRGKVESEKVDKAFNIGSFSGAVVK